MLDAAQPFGITRLSLTHPRLNCTVRCVSTLAMRDGYTNNVGELTSMVEALLWLEKEAPGPSDAPAIVYYDSTYAFHAITGTSSPEANSDLVLNARTVLSRVRLQRVIDFQYVKGDSGNHGNDWADKLAGMGSRGLQTTQSARWILPLQAPPPVDPLLVDHCWRWPVMRLFVRSKALPLLTVSLEVC